VTLVQVLVLVGKSRFADEDGGVRDDIASVRLSGPGEVERRLVSSTTLPIKKGLGTDLLLNYKKRHGGSHVSLRSAV
jgi:hypothetical protein